MINTRDTSSWMIRNTPNHVCENLRALLLVDVACCTANGNILVPDFSRGSANTNDKNMNTPRNQSTVDGRLIPKEYSPG